MVLQKKRIVCSAEKAKVSESKLLRDAATLKQKIIQIKERNPSQQENFF